MKLVLTGYYEWKNQYSTFIKKYNEKIFKWQVLTIEELEKMGYKYYDAVDRYEDGFSIHIDTFISKRYVE